MAETHVEVTIKGISPIMFHAYTGENTGRSTGDKKPRQIAVKHFHTVDHPTYGEVVVIPGRAIFAALVAAGVFHKIGKKQMTTGKSSLVPAYVTVEEMDCILLGEDGKPVTPEKGWEVDSSSVVNPSTGGRVMSYRPRVDVWSTKFTLVLSEAETVGQDKIRALLDDTGKKIGLLAWRPAKKGPYGKFVVTHFEEVGAEVNEPRKKLKVG